MRPSRTLPRLAIVSFLSLPALVRAAPAASPAEANLKRYEAIMDEGTKAAKKCDHAAAVAAFDRALAIRPNDQAALTDQGWSAFQMHALDRAEAVTRKAIAAGGKHAMDPQDHGFMYGWSFRDLDGHHWEVLWMDPKVAQS